MSWDIHYHPGTLLSKTMSEFRRWEHDILRYIKTCNSYLSFPPALLESGVPGRNKCDMEYHSTSFSIFFGLRDITGHQIAYFPDKRCQKISPGYYDIQVYHRTSCDILGCTSFNMYIGSISQCIKGYTMIY